MAQVIQYNTPFLSAFPATPAVTTKTMDQRFNQIVRLAVQVSGTPFATAIALSTKANWTTLLAASDATKIILSPLFSNSKITSSKPLETGADTNATYNGIPIYFGEGTAMFSGEFQDLDAPAINSFFSVVSGFSLSNGVGSYPLVAYWCNNDGMLFSTPTFGGLPCINLTARTRGSEGLNSSDKIPFHFYLPPNWDGVTTAPTPSVPTNLVTGAGLAVDLRTYA